MGGADNQDNTFLLLSSLTMDAPVVMVGWWWVSSYVVQGTREEMANAQEKGQLAATPERSRSRRPTRKRKQKDRAQQQREKEREREEGERERERSGGGKRAVGALWAVGSRS